MKIFVFCVLLVFDRFSSCAQCVSNHIFVTILYRASLSLAQSLERVFPWTSLSRRPWASSWPWWRWSTSPVTFAKSALASSWAKRLGRTLATGLPSTSTTIAAEPSPRTTQVLPNGDLQRTSQTSSCRDQDRRFKRLQELLRCENECAREKTTPSQMN